MTTDDALTHWRFLIDQLTPDRVAILEELSSQRHRGAFLVQLAKGYIAEQGFQADHADVPSPAGATSVDKWQKVGESVIRFFTGTRRGDAVRVNLAGMQTVDGTVERRCIFAYVPDNIAEPDAASAREAAADVLAAADELEGNRPSHVYEVD